MRCFVLLSLVALCSSTPLAFLGQQDVLYPYPQMSLLGQTMYPKPMLRQYIVKQDINAARTDPVAIKEEIVDEQPITKVGDEAVVEQVSVKKLTTPLATTGLYGRQGVKIGNTILKTPTMEETYSMGYPVPVVLKEEILGEIPIDQAGEGQIMKRLVMERPVIPTGQKDMFGDYGMKVGNTVVKTPSMNYYHQVPMMAGNTGMGSIWDTLAQQKMMMMQNPHMMMMMKYPMMMGGYYGQYNYPTMYQTYPYYLGQQY